MHCPTIVQIKTKLIEWKESCWVVQLPVMSYLLSRNYGNNEMFWWVWKSISGFSPCSQLLPRLPSHQLSRNQAWHQLNRIITVKITGIGLLQRPRWWDGTAWSGIKFNFQFLQINLLVINFSMYFKDPSSSLRQEDHCHNNLESFRPQVPNKKFSRWVKAI